MAESSAKKTAPQLLLRFKVPENYPDVGRLVDEDFDTSRVTSGKEEWTMRYEQEQLKEEEADTTKKDEDFFRRRRRQRRYYKRKQNLVLHNANDDLFLEARPISLDSAEEHDENNLQKRLDPKSADNIPFRHVLLQFVKRQYEGGEQTEIHVLPVSDVYAFRKKKKQKDQLLSDLDVAYSAEKERLKRQNNRYRDLLNGKSDLLAKQQQQQQLEASGRLRGKANPFDDDPFTFAVNRAMGRRRGGGALSSSAVSQPAAMLNENGVDLEEVERENDFLGGDYTTRFADDEEEHIHIIQKRMDNAEEEDTAQNWRPEDEEMDLDDDDDEDEDEDEDDGGEGGISGSGGMKKGITTSDAVAAISLIGSKNLRQDDLLAARNFMSTIKPKAAKSSSSMAAAAAAAAAATVSAVALDVTGKDNAAMDVPAASSNGKSAQKRSRDDLAATGEAPSDGKEAKRVRFPSTATLSDADAALMPPPPAKAAAPVRAAVALSSSSASSSSVGKSEFDLSMDGVRRFIRNQGGKVRTQILVEAFKPQMKAHSKQLNDKKAGQKLFLSIVDAITDTVEDPILGTALALKQSGK